MDVSPLWRKRYLALAIAWTARNSFAFLLLIGLGLGQPALAQSYQFSSFSVEGEGQIELPALLGFAGLTPGQTYSAAELNEALQRLTETGLFEKVEFFPQGGRLVIRTTEFPIVNQISIEGNRLIRDETALEIIATEPRRAYNPSQVEADTNALVDAYQDLGRFGAEITPKIIERSGNRVDVVFEINEGRVVEIERISFVGNRSFSDRRLRRVLETKQAGALRALIGKDTFVEDRIEFDKAVLRDFYHSRGYVDFEVLSISTEFSRERNAFFLTVNVQEGQKYRFGEITTVSEIPEVDVADFDRLARIRAGRTYTPELVDNTISRMEQLALKKGLNLLRVDPRVTRNDRELLLDIEFALVEGERIVVERIDIEGNVTTLDRVIRRQFRIVEGDPFNPREIREAAARIRALGLFAETSVRSGPGTTEGEVVVDVDVEEVLTGSLTFGAAYNLSTGIGLTANFRERNFRGRGQTLNFDFQLGLDNADGGATFVEPAFLGRDIEFRADAEDRQTDFDYTDYDTQIYRIRNSFEFPLSDRSRIAVRATAEGNRILNVDAGSSTILMTEEAAGQLNRAALGYTFRYDTRSTGVNTNAGVLFRFGQDFGVNSDGSQSIKSTALASAETAILNEDVTIRATLEGGALYTNGAASRLNDRFFLTSILMRGFAPAGVGPRDLTVANQDALGGNFFAVARMKTEFPLFLPEEFGVSGGVFVDVGSVWGLDNDGGGAVDATLRWRSTAGVSLFWQTPIGPLRFNFSQVLVKEPYDIGQTFDLAISTQF